MQDTEGSLIAVIENRVKEPKALKSIKKIVGNWCWVANYQEAPGGRIWVLWNQAVVDFRMTEMLTQFIHGQLTLLHNQASFSLSIGYGLHTVQDRKALWNDLKGLIDHGRFQYYCVC